jgi:hypothetical protein
MPEQDAYEASTNDGQEANMTTTIRCDGSFRCPATDHIEGCYTGDGHPDAQPPTDG